MEWRTHFGATPLAIACRRGHVGVVETLTNYGCAMSVEVESSWSSGVVAVLRAYESNLARRRKEVRLQKRLRRRRCAACALQLDVAEPPMKVCADCRGVSYCSRACQRQDWYGGGHRDQCTTG